MVLLETSRVVRGGGGGGGGGGGYRRLPTEGTVLPFISIYECVPEKGTPCSPFSSIRHRVSIFRN